MDATVVTIGGNDITVPNYEIPRLIKTLTDVYQQLLDNGAISAAPQDGFMTYEQCSDILSEEYSGKLLRNHAGRLWGAMCRVTKHGLLHFDTLCTTCGVPVEKQGWTNDKRCYHNLQSVGHRMVIISRKSMFANLSDFSNGSYKQVGTKIKSDYMFVVDKSRTT